MITKLSQNPDPCFDMIFMGDFCPLDTINPEQLVIGEKLKDFLKRCNCITVNLECPLTTSETRIAKKGPHLKANPESVQLLNKLGVKACNLANNHIRDYGREGIRDTCDTLDANNIKHFGLWGEYGNQNLILEIKGQRVGLISFTENEFSTERSEGSAAVGLDCSLQYKQISEMKENADYIIAQYHGGVELYSYPTPNQQKYCQFLIDAGVDMVICHHSHIISGYEEYSGKRIFYGLGNFFFPEAGNQGDWFVGLGLGLHFQDDRLTIFPITLDMQENLLDISDAELIKVRMKEINRIIADEQMLKRAWDDYCFASQDRTLKSVLKPGRFFRMLIKLGFMKNWLENKADISLLNLLRCESHHERITHTLELINERKNNRRHT